jgi:hypothetical protein
MRELGADVASLPDETRSLIVLRIANALDDHRDLGMRYRGCSGAALAADAEIPAMIELADKVGRPDLAAELRGAVDAEVVAEIPTALATGFDACRSVLPQSARLRLVPWLRAEQSPVAKVAHRSLWRLRARLFGR